MNLRCKLILLVTLAFPFSMVAQPPNTVCGDMQPICTNAGLNFTAQANGANVITSEPGNNYSCLGYSPNPSWYYFEISTAGNIDMSLTAPTDIDFIIWGPFTDLPTAQSQCGNLGDGGTGQNVIDCSYSGTNMETPSIPSAQVGEVYVMLITNYANNVQDLELTQTGGTGATDCSIIPPCQSDAGTFSYYKNGTPVTNSGIVLCHDDEIEVVSNSDYILPNDTLNGNYESALMFMLYDQAPSNPDPNADPGFLGTYFADSIFNDINNPASSPIVGGGGPGYGTYYLVPVSGDDGEYNGNPNGGVDYDKDGNGCFDLGDPIEVTYLPPISIASAVSCDGTVAGNSIEFTITGGYPAILGGNYTVTNGGAGSLSSGSVGSGGTTSVTGLQDGDLAKIYVSDANNCIDSLSVIFDAPNFSIVSTDATDCGTTALDDGSATVNVTAGSGNGPGYSIDMNGNVTSGQTATELNLSAGTNVDVVVTDVEGCATADNITVGSLGVTIEATNEVVEDLSCGGADDGSLSVDIEVVSSSNETIVDLSVTDPGNNTTSDPNAVGQVNYTYSDNNLAAGTYIITVEASNGCIFDFQYTVNEPTPLDVNVISFSEPKCFNGNDGSIDVLASGGSSPYTFDWSGAINSNLEDIDQLEAGTYDLTVTDDNGCTTTISQTLQNPDPFSAEVLTKNPTCNGYEDGIATVVNVQGNQGQVSYVWSTDNPNPNSVSNVNNLVPGNFTVQLFDENGCDTIIEFEIDETPPFVINNLDSVASKCRSTGTYPGTGQVSVNVSGSNGGISVMWFGNGDTTNTPTWGNRTPGTYTYVATDVKGCELTGSVYVDSINPQADFTVDPNQGVAPLSVDITNTSSGIDENNASYTWDPGFGVYNSTENYNYAPDTTYTEGGIYTISLVVTNEYGCKDSVSKEVEVFTPLEYTAPNIFTPNGDGVNDYMYISGEGITDENFYMSIVNRWGEKIFETSTPGQTNGWDGTNKKGKPMPEGVYQYVFTLQSEEGEEVKGQGFVHLMRTSK